MNLSQIIFINGLILIALSCNKQDTNIADDIYEESDITKTICQNPPISSDYREYQHGIDFIQKNDSIYYLIWASSGIYPSGAKADGSWTHDVYYAEININHPRVNAKLLISADEAQEPPSSAVSVDGNIFITMEDGYKVKNGIGQRYAVYNSNMQAVKDYPNMIFDGGHSAHVASVGDLFVVFWSNDWDDSVPGADGIGTGLDVLLDVYSSSGNFIHRAKVATDDNRDWWPIIAGSNDNVCLVWQRYQQGDKYSMLMYSIYNPKTGIFIKESKEIENHLRYYTYDVQYYPKIQRFLIVGAYYNGGGFAILLDDNGNIIDKITDIPEIIREAQGVATNIGENVLVAYAKQAEGIMLFDVSKNKIKLLTTISDSYKWFGIGTDGIFLNDTSLYMINLSPCGLVKRQIYIDI